MIKTELLEETQNKCLIEPKQVTSLPHPSIVDNNDDASMQYTTQSLVLQNPVGEPVNAELDDIGNQATNANSVSAADKESISDSVMSTSKQQLEHPENPQAPHIQEIPSSKPCREEFSAAEDVRVSGSNSDSSVDLLLPEQLMLPSQKLIKEPESAKTDKTVTRTILGEKQLETPHTHFGIKPLSEKLASTSLYKNISSAGILPGVLPRPELENVELDELNEPGMRVASDDSMSSADVMLYVERLEVQKLHATDSLKPLSDELSCAIVSQSAERSGEKSRVDSFSESLSSTSVLLAHQQLELPKIPSEDRDYVKTFGQSPPSKRQHAIAIYKEMDILGRFQGHKEDSHPMITLPPHGGFWLDICHKDIWSDARGQPLLTPSSPRVNLMTEDIGMCYRKYFVGREHLNFLGIDDRFGPVVVSMKTELKDDREHVRVMLRMRTGTMHRLLPISWFDKFPNPDQLVRLLNDEIDVDNLMPVLCANASQLIADYDDSVLPPHFKFGVIYQRIGQHKESELFGNKESSTAFDEFIDMLGERVLLKEHTGYRGGLDVQRDTESTSVYEIFKDREIMFHVSTLLPYKENDPDQVQRRRHICNDLVVIIFQDPNACFSPDMITSEFLHVFFVVQPLEPSTSHTSYKLSVAAHADVPYFGPPMPEPAVFRKGPDFKHFLFTKLLNAETACLQARKFFECELCNRSTLLQRLVDQLDEKYSLEDMTHHRPPSEASQPETSNMVCSSSIIPRMFCSVTVNSPDVSYHDMTESERETAQLQQERRTRTKYCGCTIA